MKKQKNNNNPIDEVIEKMLKKDAKSCKLAKARLTQIEKTPPQIPSESAGESLPRDSKEKK